MSQVALNNIPYKINIGFTKINLPKGYMIMFFTLNISFPADQPQEPVLKKCLY